MCRKLRERYYGVSTDGLYNDEVRIMRCTSYVPSEHHQSRGLVSQHCRPIGPSGGPVLKTLLKAILGPMG